MRFIKNIENNEQLLNESIEDRGIFKALFLGGITGAGKSYTFSKIKSGQIEPRIVNTDTWSEYFGGDWLDVYDTSKKLITSQLALYFNSMLPLVCDQTSTLSSTTFRRVNILERMGYDTAMIFVNTSLETAIARAEARGQIETRASQLKRKYKGHNEPVTRKVAVEDIIEYHRKAQEIKPVLKSHFPIFLEIKNDSGELTEDIVLNAFKRMLFFFDSPVQNPVGQDIITTLTNSGEKYLSPSIYSMAELKTIASGWYKR